MGLLGLSFKQELTSDWLSKSEELLWSSYVATSDAKIYKASGINSSLEWTLCQAQAKFLHSQTQKKLLTVAEELEEPKESSKSLRRKPWKNLLWL